MKNKIIQCSLISILLVIMIFAGCKKDHSDGDHNGGGHDSTSNKVSIANFAFTPSNLTIAKGATITWTNNDSTPHTVTADDNNFTSGTLNQGDSYMHTFTNTGTVNYHCSLHTSMKASVIVQ